MITGQREFGYEPNMDMSSGSLQDRIRAAQNHMKLIKQRAPFLGQKVTEARLSLMEETLVNLAAAFDVLLEAKEKKLWPV